ncbi:sulfite exporter TauE/SafE family protein [Shimazuella sp. AN120528]|uniref:sulfite exporter TauE/SafE family protein n=1 Tax=Shimazuella soli TaxID=1892854 RepID=UPI001F0FD0F7|nr:sulfite exporter TauE/SafE family protein [Shimazuella soli]MCH5585665.1 sulfite exporter TauE/SafE family protein [Shimazuella soli]
MIWIEWVILFSIGLFAGTLGSLVGIGGGIIIVPSLLYIATVFSSLSSLSAQVAAGTSLLIVMLTAVSSIITFHKQKRIDYRSGMLFFIGAGPGALAGAYFSKFFSTDSFMLGFGIFLLFLSLLMMLKDRLKPITFSTEVKRTYTDSTGEIHHYGFHTPTAIIVSFIIGIISSLFGIGGGAMLVPMMLIIFRFPPLVATATSMFVIFLSSITGSITHILQGHISWMLLLLIAPGSWIGGQLGAYLSQKMSNRVLLIIFRITLILVAIKMILDGLHL